MSKTHSSLGSKIIIAGGTGFLGQLLAASFLKDGYDVVILSRGSFPMPKYGRIVCWDGKSLSKWTDQLEGAKVLVNLTGRSIDCRHTSSNKNEIIESRLKSTRVLGKAVLSCNKPPSVWLNASSMALYGQCLGNACAHDENSPIREDGFLEEVTVSWEDEFHKFTKDGVRQIALRISFILGVASGAFPLLKRLSSLGLGGKQGTGAQWMSWLHQDDWVGIIRFLCVQECISGPVNVTAPKPVLNKDFMKILSGIVGPFGIGLPAPSFGVKMGCQLLGSAPELALQSRRVVSRVLKVKGYKFKYPDLFDAISHLTVKPSH